MNEISYNVQNNSLPQDFFGGGKNVVRGFSKNRGGSIFRARSFPSIAYFQALSTCMCFNVFGRSQKINFVGKIIAKKVKSKKIIDQKIIINLRYVYTLQKIIWIFFCG